MTSASPVIKEGIEEEKDSDGEASSKPDEGDREEDAEKSLDEIIDAYSG